jgi:hypothetical protein
MSKAKVTGIWLNRAEGPVALCGERSVRNFAEANDVIRSWARTAPKGGGYDKCDFKVSYDNGDTYSGRYDMTYDDVCGADMLQKHIRSNVDFYSGKSRPLHMDEKRYRAYLALEYVAEAAAQLVAFGEACEIGDSA